MEKKIEQLFLQEAEEIMNEVKVDKELEKYPFPEEIDERVIERIKNMDFEDTTIDEEELLKEIMEEDEEEFLREISAEDEEELLKEV